MGLLHSTCLQSIGVKVEAVTINAGSLTLPVRLDKHVCEEA